MTANNNKYYKKYCIDIILLLTTKRSIAFDVTQKYMFYSGLLGVTGLLGVIVFCSLLNTFSQSQSLPQNNRKQPVNKH